MECPTCKKRLGPGDAIRCYAHGHAIPTDLTDDKLDSIAFWDGYEIAVDLTTVSLIAAGEVKVLSMDGDEIKLELIEKAIE